MITHTVAMSTAGVIEKLFHKRIEAYLEVRYEDFQLAHLGKNVLFIRYYIEKTTAFSNGLVY
jgi:hypothetical protein